MSRITFWDEIEKELGSDISTFDKWLSVNDITIFVTGIFEKDLEDFRNEKENNGSNIQ